jgi:glucokinase
VTAGDPGPVAIGVDVGGTTTCAGVVTAAGRVVVDEQLATHAAGAGRAGDTIVTLVERMKRRVEALGHETAGVGVGLPGIVDAARGQVGPEIPHVPELAGRRLGPELTEALGVPVFVENDVNALALAEWRYGAGRGASSLVVLAPGTGFGSGIVLGGQLVRGAGGFGGELGHVPVKFDGPPCWCGGRGCLAVYASGRGIAEAARARVAGHPEAPMLVAAGGDPMAITARDVFRAAAERDPAAAAIIDDACRALGAMIAVVVNGLNPDVVVVTGGVTASYAARERTILAVAAEYAFARAIAATRVVFVPGDKRVTMRGAAALVFHELERVARAVPLARG